MYTPTLHNEQNPSIVEPPVSGPYFHTKRQKQQDLGLTNATYPASKDGTPATK